MSKQTKVHEAPAEVLLGISKAPITITMVTNPLCKPCAKAHRVIDALLEDFPNDLQVKIVFAVANRWDGEGAKVAKRLISIANNEPSAIREAMRSWYAQNNPKYEQWIHQITSYESSLNVTEKLDKHIEWCQLVDIQLTPTFFVNEYQLPAPYNIDDLKYYVKEIAQNELVTK